MMFDVAKDNNKEFLNIHNNLLIPYDLWGGTDIILVDKDCVKGSLTKVGIHAVIELKKEVQPLWRSLCKRGMKWVLGEQFIFCIGVFADWGMLPGLACTIALTTINSWYN